MKTIQFILSLMVVGLLASCSADSDVLNEMEEHNQLPNDEYVTVSLDLSAGLTTRATEEVIQKKENKISNYTIKVFGDQGVLLATLTGSGSNVNTELNIKKQDLIIYAMANISEDAIEMFEDINTLSQWVSAFEENNIYDYLGTTEPSDLPKSGYLSVDKVDCGTNKHEIQLEQLTTRIDAPEIKNEDYTFTSLQIGDYNLNSFPSYIYPGNYSVILFAEYTNGSTYSFTNGNSENFSSNTIYKAMVQAVDPTLPAALWIDWYVAPMLEKNISGTVGGN